MAIIEHAYANGLAGPKPPKVRTGKKIALSVRSFGTCRCKNQLKFKEGIP